MKTNLKLNKLAANAMNEKEMANLKGGVTKVCGCGCVNNNTGANLSANSGPGYTSPNMSGKNARKCYITC